MGDFAGLFGVERRLFQPDAGYSVTKYLVAGSQYLAEAGEIPTSGAGQPEGVAEHLAGGMQHSSGAAGYPAWAGQNPDWRVQGEN